MKSVSPALAAHLGGELTTLAELVKITRQDGAVIALTTHDADLVVAGVTYAADGSFSPGARTEDASGGSFDVMGVIGGAGITQSDIEAGLYDHARIDVAVCNWADLSQGVLAVQRGWIGEVTTAAGRYTAALRGLGDLLERRVGETYTPECRYDLGDGRCGVDLEALTVVGTVTAVMDRGQFSDSSRTEADGTFDGARLTWTSGQNAGAAVEVNSWSLDGTVFTLWLAPPFPLAVGDAYRVAPGCDKRFATCRARFGNGLNYGGFPHLPGLGKILLYPDGT